MASQGMAKKFEPVLRSFPKGKGPNVIYIQHESLSGSLMLNTDEGVKAMVKDMFICLIILHVDNFSSHYIFVSYYYMLFTYMNMFSHSFST